MRVAVVGGGIAGLSAAYRLQEGARKEGFSIRVHLFEKSNRLGGKILTDRMDGFVVEGGPDTFVSTKPWGIQLAQELGMEDRLIGADMDRRQVFVVHEGRLVELPDGLAMMVPTKLWPILKTPLLTPLGKVRMGLDVILPAESEGEDESLGSFITRRLGREAYERLIEPLMSGIYAGDGDKLSLKATFPFLKEWEKQYGSLARGAMALRRKRAAYNRSNGRRSIFLTPETGLAEMVEALMASFQNVELHLGSEVTSIERVKGGYRLQVPGEGSHEVQSLILATPAFITARFLREIDPQLASILESIQYVSTATISFGFQRKALNHPLEGHGYVIPRRAGRAALACTWTSSKFPHRAPEGSALLRVFVGRAGQEDLATAGEEDLERIARDELRETMGVIAEPQFTQIYSWPQAMPQYNLGHPDRLEEIKARLQDWPGLQLAGAAYEGVGIPDCIHSGEMAAEEVLKRLMVRGKLVSEEMEGA